MRMHWHVVAFLCLGQLFLPVTAQEPGEDVFNVNTCESPARDDASCGQVRWGWGDCPGSRMACDWCYGADGQIFAYVRRTNRTYKLSSACEMLADLPAEDVFWVADDPDDADVMEEAGGQCQPQGRQLICQVDPDRYRDVLAQGKPSRRGTPAREKDPEKKDPKKKDPEKEAAAEILRQWNENEPIEKPDRKVRYAAVGFGGATLHAVKTDGPIRIGHADLTNDPLGDTVPELAAKDPWAIGGTTGTFFAYPFDEDGNPLKGEDGKYLPRKPAGPVFSGGKPAFPVGRSMGAAGAVPRSFLGYGKDGFFVEDLAAGDTLASFQKQVQDLVQKTGVREGVGGLGRLLENGKDVHTQVAFQKQKLVGGQAGDAKDARAVAGIQTVYDSKSKRTALVLLIQEGRKRGPGAGTGQLAEILQHLGVSDAVLLDGGGSTQISIPSRGVLYRGDGRTGPTAILF
jgi:hypothetical protein